MIHVVPLNVPFLVIEIEDHKEKKKEILSCLEEMPNIDLSLGEQTISKTDWMLEDTEKRTYIEAMRPIAEKTKSAIENVFKFPQGTLNVSGMWFQQYETADHHDWHIHKNTMFNAVYYVELSDDSPKTSFAYLNKEFEFKAKEGQILVFPSCFLHRSIPNKSKQRKTIVAINYG
jgi:hypothetical protein